MHIVHRHVLLALAISILAITLTGCPSAKSGGASQFMGTWHNTTDPNMVLEVKGDHKAVLRDKNGPTDVTWEITNAGAGGGEDKLIVHGAMGLSFEMLHNSDGTLRDTMSSGTWKKK